MEKYFDNLTLGQFLLTGLKPIKVYVDGRYLILTDTDDVEDPLYGQGMTINGQMVHFDYRLIDHILVGDKPVTLDMLSAEEEEGTEEAGEEEEEAADEETEEEVEEEGHIRLGSLVEVDTEKFDKDIENLNKKLIKIKKKKLDAEEAGMSEDLEECGCGGEAGEPGIDTISEPYMFKVGDLVHDINPACPHYGSKGIVISMEPDNVVRYAVTNNGGSYEQGDILTKSADQLEPM